MTSHRLPVQVVVLAILLLSGACGDSKDASETEPSPREATAAAQLIDYTKDDDRGAVLRKASDVQRLHDAPDDFKHFMAGVVDAKVTSFEPDPDCPFFVSVRKLDTSGFAYGGYISCGGNAEIWAKVDGVWREIWAGQDYPDCKTMNQYSVPKALVIDGKCYDDATEKVKDYTG
jgi:hypothetical protein